jgi:ribonuclease Z
MGNAERTEPVLMIGPKGLEKTVNALRTIAPELPFDILYHELSGDEEVIDMGDFTLTAFRVRHNVTCYGYMMEIKRVGKFDVERAKENGIEMKYWSRLQKGEIIEADGVTYTPDMVLGPDRKGLKVTYCTDTRPVDNIVKHAYKSDLFICEGMYGEPDKVNKAKEYKHMTFYEAAELAKKAEVTELWLTHYSPSTMWPEEFIKPVRNIFANAYTAKDGQSVELKFEE